MGSSFRDASGKLHPIISETVRYPHMREMFKWKVGGGSESDISKQPHSVRRGFRYELHFAADLYNHTCMKRMPTLPFIGAVTKADSCALSIVVAWFACAETDQLRSGPALFIIKPRNEKRHVIAFQPHDLVLWLVYIFNLSRLS